MEYRRILVFDVDRVDQFVRLRQSDREFLNVKKVISKSEALNDDQHIRVLFVNQVSSFLSCHAPVVKLNSRSPSGLYS